METIIPIEYYEVGKGCHMKVDLLINNKKASFILDTGASITVFDETRVKNLTSRKIKSHGATTSGAGGSTEQKEVLINTIQIGLIYMQDYKAAVIDLSHINSSYKDLGVEEIDGVLGNDILNFYNALIDFKEKKLVLHNF